MSKRFITCSLYVSVVLSLFVSVTRGKKKINKWSKWRVHTLFKSITFVEVVALRSRFAGNPAHLELLPPREGKITSAGDKEVDGASSAIVPESGVELCQVKRQIERPSLLRALLTNRHINCRRPNV